MQQELSKKTKNLIVFVMIIGCFFSALNQTLLNVALPHLMKVFDVSPDTIQWLTTGFMLVNGVLIPLTAYLMKRFTTRDLFICSITLLLVGSIICAAAPSFNVLLIGRMIQAAGAAIILPLMMTVILYLYPSEERGSVMGKIGFAIIFAPAIAPTLSGSVIDYTSWRWLFIGMIPISILIIFLAWKLLVNVAETENAKLDIGSMLLSTTGFALLLFGFSSAGSKGWSDPIVWSTTLIGLIIVSIFCRVQIRSNNPLLNLNVFHYRMFSITTIINVVVTILMCADLILLPMFLQDSRGFTALQAGILLFPGAAINAALSPVTGILQDKYGPKPLFFIGISLVAVSMLAVTNLTEATPYLYLLLRTVVLRIGLSFITMPLNAAALNSLPLELGSHGSAVNNTIRQLAGAMGTAVVITVYSIQTKAHYHEHDATVLATNDAYKLMFIISLLALIVVFFVPGRKKELELEQHIRRD